MRPTRWLVLLLFLVGLALTPLSVQAAPPCQGTVVHTVAHGETMFSIARRYGVTVDAVCAANNIADPARIYAGQRLVIPQSGGAATTPPATATHTVQAGENLYRIALRYGTTVQALAELNNIFDPNRLVVGQTLRVPGNGAAPPPPSTATTHVVQRGETLTAIAARYAVSAWALARANGIANPSLIYAGQLLTIPTADSSTPAPAPGASAGKRIVIDLSEQHLYAYQNGTLVYSFVASTGMPGAGTRSGVFAVLDKIPNAYAATWDLQMPYWLGIYWAGSLENGIHALPILSNGQRLWEGYLGTPVSFGCIILGTVEARQLYNWADVGTPVIIQP